MEADGLLKPPLLQRDKHDTTKDTNLPPISDSLTHTSVTLKY